MIRDWKNRFVRKMDEIAKFSTLDGKTEFTILDGIWTKNGQMANWLQEKNVKFFQIHWLYHVFTVGLIERMRIIIGMYQIHVQMNTESVQCLSKK